MAFHTFTASDYRDFSQKYVQMATSKHISAFTVNAAGTGYNVGDVIKVAHAGAALEATMEVLTLTGGAGTGIATAQLRNMGAYSNRVATVVINAGGTSYPLSATIFLQIQGGTSTEKARVSATTNGSGVVTAVSLVDGGGAYSSAPSATGATTLRNGPSTNTTGSGATIDTTMTGLVGTSGVATTAVTGGGSGATLNLTLTDTGWTAVRTTRDYSFNSINDEREVILQGTVSGGDVPFVGFRTYTAGVTPNIVYGMALTGFDDYNSSLAYTAQPNAGPNTVPTSAGTGGAHMLLRGADNSTPTMVSWFFFTERAQVAVAKCVNGGSTSYMSMYMGLMNPYGTQTESPYPMLIAGTSRIHDRNPFSGSAVAETVTGLTAALTDQTPSAGDVTSSPIWYRRHSDGSYNPLANVSHSAGGAAQIHRRCLIYPYGVPDNLGSAIDQIVVADETNANNTTTFMQIVTGGGGGAIIHPAGAATQRLFPTLTGNESLLIPATVVTTPSGATTTVEHTIRGELENVYWLSATKSDGTSMVSEDTITIGSVRYRVFGNAERTQRYDYFCCAEI